MNKELSVSKLVETCAMVYVINNNRVLLIKHIKNGQFMGVGGHKELDELLIECAIRETLEESGVKLTWADFADKDILGKPSSICSYTFKMENHGHEVFVFIASTSDASLQLESQDGGWYTYNEASKLDMGDHVKEVLDYLDNKRLIK